MTLPQIPGLATRFATRSDVAAITDLIAACEVANDGVAEVHPTDVEQDLDLAAEGKVIVAEAPDQLVAWATLADGRATVDVHPGWRGRGIGSVLLAWTEAQAGAAGMPEVRQVVTNADTGAHRLFEGGRIGIGGSPAPSSSRRSPHTTQPGAVSSDCPRIRGQAR